MTEMFFNLEREKRERILKAACEEFAERGFEHASTNRIVKEAKIGKGMLFYYFKSKKELYHYLVQYCTDYIVEHYLDKIDENETDCIEKYRHISMLKMKVYAKEPYVLNFLGNIYLNNDVEKLPNELYERMGEVRMIAYEKLYKNVDTSLFRKDIPPEKIYQLLQWSMEGYEKDLTNRLKNINLQESHLEPYWEEFYDLLDMLKIIYYDEGGSHDEGSRSK